MDRVGEELDSVRRSVMLGRSLGLTKLYNLVHDPAVTDEEIRRLREIHTEIDYATAQAYGWDVRPRARISRHPPGPPVHHRPGCPGRGAGPAARAEPRALR